MAAASTVIGISYPVMMFAESVPVQPTINDSPVTVLKTDVPSQFRKVEPIFGLFIALLVLSLPALIMPNVCGKKMKLLIGTTLTILGGAILFFYFVPNVPRVFSQTTS